MEQLAVSRPISPRSWLFISHAKTYFYSLDLENFATASRRCIGVVNKLIGSQLLDYTSDGRVRRGRMHKFVYYMYVLLGSRVVSVLDSGAVGPGFKLQLRRCRVTVLGLGKLFTHIVPLFTKQQNW